MKNYTINTILTPTDFSETSDIALMYAIGISKITNAKLVLIHVIELTAFTLQAENISVGGVYEEMIEAGKERLAKLAAKIREEYNIKVSVNCYSGSVYENILRAAHIANADLIVMGTHGTSGIKEWIFGSNAYSVVNDTTIPVLTFNLRSEGNPINKIVFPFNESEISLKKSKQVIELAKIFEASVLLFGYIDKSSSVSSQSLKENGLELAKLFESHKIKTSLNIATGEDYAEEILRFSRSEKADMITVATSKSNNVDSVFKTKPDRKLVNHSEIPVLSVPVE